MSPKGFKDFKDRNSAFFEKNFHFVRYLMASFI